MSTPHNEAEPGEIAKSVLMPGDPLRAKVIAEKFLENTRLVNKVRNMYAYTGEYYGKEVTVMASGMGMPSMGIYSYELFSQYGVDQIIRIGSAGAYVTDLKLKDVVLAESVWSETSFARTQNGYQKDTILPDSKLNAKILKTAGRLGIVVKATKVHSTDVFYCENNVDNYETINRKHQCTCVDMESFALFHNAKVLGKRAACLLTISDSFPSNEKATAEERQNSFMDMIKVALEASI